MFDIDPKYVFLALYINAKLSEWFAKSLMDGKVDAKEWGALTNLFFASLEQAGVDVEWDVINVESQVKPGAQVALNF